MRPPTNQQQLIYDCALDLLREWRAAHPGQAIRLLGVGGQDLMDEQQLDLFSADQHASGAPVDSAVDEIRERFSELGSAALRSARTIDSERQD